MIEMGISTNRGGVQEIRINHGVHVEPTVRGTRSFDTKSSFLRFSIYFLTAYAVIYSKFYYFYSHSPEEPYLLVSRLSVGPAALFLFTPIKRVYTCLPSCPA